MITVSGVLNRIGAALSTDSDLRTLLSAYRDPKIIVGRISDTEELQSGDAPVIEIATDGDVSVGYIPDHEASIVIRVIIHDSEENSDGVVTTLSGYGRGEEIVQRMLTVIQAIGEWADEIATVLYTIDGENYPLWVCTLKLNMSMRQGLAVSPSL